MIEPHFGGDYQKQALLVIAGIALLGAVAVMATAVWLLSVDGLVLALLIAVAALALAVPSTAVYVLSSFHVDRRIEAHEDREDRQHENIGERLSELERAVPEENGSPGQPDARSGTLLHDPEPGMHVAEDAIGPPPVDEPPERIEGGEDPAAKGMDPWLGAFGGCLQRREVLDREPLPRDARPDDPRGEED